MEWKKGQYPGTWFAGTSRHRQDVIGPVLIRREQGIDVPYYILKKNRVPNSLGNKKDYLWGFFIPPEFMPNNARVSDGSWAFSSFATEENWNYWWENGVIDHRPSDKPQDNPSPSPEQEPSFTPAWQNTTPITKNIDWRIAAAVALIVIIGIYAAVKLR